MYAKQVFPSISLLRWKPFIIPPFTIKLPLGSSGLTHICSALQQQFCQQSCNSGEFHLLSNASVILSMPQPYVGSQDKEVLLCFPQDLDTQLPQHAIWYLQWVQRSQKWKICPSCPHDKSLESRLGTWLQEKLGVSHCCDAICKHQPILCCATLPSP